MSLPGEAPARVGSTPLPSTSNAIVVATDATPDSDGAVRVGFALSKRDSVAVDFFSVIEPLSLFEPDGTPTVDAEELVRIACDARNAELIRQRDRTHPGIPQWPFTTEVGPRVERITSRARERHATCMLLGLGKHGVGARVARRETALRVIRSATVPVLAVPSDGWGVPHSAVAAIDFTTSSEDAARAAINLLGVEGTLYVAHVTPRVPVPQGDSRSWDEITTNASAITRQLESVVHRLDPSPGIQIQYALLHGEPAHELLAFAQEVGGDLIAAGSHGRSLLGRLVLGSVSTKLIRTADRMILVAPARSDDAPTSELPNDWT